MTLQEEVAAAIRTGFNSCGALTTTLTDSLEPDVIKIFVEGYDEPIRVLPKDVEVPIPPFAPEHANGILLDVQAILAQGNYDKE
jgi:hypothetical protein